MKIGNEFCEMDVDLLRGEHANHKKWGWRKAARQKIFNMREEARGIRNPLYPPAQRYKDDYVRMHRIMIKQIAAQYHIPAYLLASIASGEATGKPDYLKPIVWMGRVTAERMIPFSHRLFHIKRPEDTSMGIAAMQLGTAARQINAFDMIRSDVPWWRKPLAYMRQAEIGSCLFLSDRSNLQFVALYLRNMILYDYPDADTEHLTDDQVILVGSRYNRGEKRDKADLIRSIHTKSATNKSDPNYEIRQWTSYGRALLEHRDHVQAILDED